MPNWKFSTICAAILLSWASPAAASDIRTLALENTHSPGGPPNSRFELFGTFFGVADLSMNRSGRTAFPASMSTFYGGVTSNNDSGIWAETGGTLDLFVREGDLAPETFSGEVFDSFDSQLLMNDIDHVAFAGFLRNGVGGVSTANDSGIWSGPKSGIRLVAREGSAAPDGSGAFFSSFASSSNGLILNDVGQTAFFGRLTGSGITTANDSGIWSEGPGSLALMAREGYSAPGTPVGAVFEDFSGAGDGASLNNLGRVAFRGLLKTGVGGVTTSNNAGIWSDVSGTVSLVMRSGTAAPGAPVGAIFDGFGAPPKINDSNRLLARGFLRVGLGGVTSSTSDGLWSDRSGTMNLVARGGMQSPGAPAGANLGTFVWYSMNNSGKVAFSGDFQTGSVGVTTDNNGGLWSEGLGSLRLVAREGDQAPETPTGAVFKNIGPPTLNDAGQVAFSASLLVGVGGVTSANDSAIWAEDLLGNLRLIMREGDMIEVSPGVMRTVTGLRFSSEANGGGHRRGFSDTGELVFWANTNVGEALFVSSKVAGVQLAGDFNEDGTVNAADYVVWRNGGATAGDYATWRANFGRAASDSNLAMISQSVPEPDVQFFVTASTIIGLFSRLQRRR